MQNSFPVTRVELSPNSPVHRVSSRNIKLYVSANGYSYQEVEDWTAEVMENGGLRLLLHTPIQARYVKVQSLFDDRDAQFAPVNRAEFINQAKDLIDVYYLVTARQEEYQYDAGGNRSQATITGRQAKQTNYQYYPNSNRLMMNGEYGFVYDANGNLIAKGTNYTRSGNTLTIQPEGEYWNYRYDLLNRLISVEKNGKTIATYSYNEKGLRVKKLAPEATTYYSFNQEGQVVYEQINETTLSYIYVLGRHFAMVEGENTYFYHTDHLGSTVLVTNNEGQDVWSNEYTPFGQLSVETGFFAHAIKFTGKDLDPDTGLYYFNARWYDPSLGRFISEDPIKDGLNWYTYVMNNPLRYVDPDGEAAVLSAVIYGGFTFAGFYASNAPAINQVIQTAAQTVMEYGSILLDKIPAIVDAGSKAYDMIQQAKAGTDESAKQTIEGAKEFGKKLIDHFSNKTGDPGAQDPKEKGPKQKEPKYTKNNFRDNLAKLTGEKPIDSDAHHMFPKKFESAFKKLNINIHDPKYGTWWERSSHRSNAHQYNIKWEEFLRTQPSTEAAKNFAKNLASQYKLKINF